MSHASYCSTGCSQSGPTSPRTGGPRSGSIARTMVVNVKDFILYLPQGSAIGFAQGMTHPLG